MPIRKYHYYQYSTELKKNLAGRYQIPLKVTFAMTVYKCQGQTLDNVVVHCNNIERSGEFAVAIGRVRNCDNLELVNFSYKCCVPAPTVVQNFYSSLNQNIEPSEDFLCCNSITTEPYSQQIMPEILADDETSDNDHNENDTDVDEDIYESAKEQSQTIKETLLKETSVETKRLAEMKSLLELISADKLAKFVANIQSKLLVGSDFNGIGTNNCK